MKKHFNIGCGNPRPVSDMVNILGKLLNTVPQIEFIGQQTGDAQFTHCDISKLKTDLHYTPKIDLENGLAKFVEWFKSNGHLKYLI